MRTLRVVDDEIDEIGELRMMWCTRCVRALYDAGSPGAPVLVTFDDDAADCLGQDVPAAGHVLESGR